MNRSSRGFAAILLTILMVVGFCTSTSGLQLASRGLDDPRLKTDPGGAGSLPKPTSPTAPGPNNPTPPLTVETDGLLIEALTRQPIPSALVVVTDATGHPVGVDITDASGSFTLYLAAKPGLELAVPSEGLAGIEIAAGEALLIVVP